MDPEVIHGIHVFPIEDPDKGLVIGDNGEIGANQVRTTLLDCPLHGQ